MPILNNIPRKNRIVPTGGDRTFDRSRVDHVPIGFDGLAYNSPWNSDPVTNANHHNNATIAHVGAMQVEQPGVVVPAFTFIRIHPSNKTILNRAGRVIPAVKRVFGPAKSTDTPFHPKPHVPTPRVPRRASITTDVYPAAHAVATAQHRQYPLEGLPVQPVGSFFPHTSQTLFQHTHSDLNKSRWNTVKRGAAG